MIEKLKETDDEKVWCCVHLTSYWEPSYTIYKKTGVGGTRDHVKPESIGSEAFATKFFNECDEPIQLRVISRSDALEIITEDILDHDDTGLKLGNWLNTLACVKLGKRLRVRN